ncbi:MAG: DegT/DnrJ/EryC1/StrS family aminotransferase [Candidatus Eremiobacteraeota bacterium]|nr:DegT/DnrJ/EryC1/StrS family aminotransferase [Candidatus Eremiobacteraeota bacterium]
MIPIAKPIISEREKQLVMEVLDSGVLAAGEKVREFEAQFSQYIGSPFGIAASSGTTALHMALLACGIKAGDKVVTTPFSFIATANSVLYCGAKPVFCDIDRNTYNISVPALRELLKKERDIKALLIVHLFGLSCDMDALMELVREHNLILIEDCAQAHGAAFRGKKAGSFGHASIFSFYPTKNITSGEGGMVLTSREEVARAAELLRNHGMPREYEHSIIGYNYRMTNIAAAIGIGQLERIGELIEKRRSNARFLDGHLKGIPGIETPSVPHEEYFHVYNQYTVKVPHGRAGLIQHLKEKGIGHKIFYPTIIPDQPLYREMGFHGDSLPVSRACASQVLSLPVHPALSGDDLERIVSTVGEYCKKNDMTPV